MAGRPHFTICAWAYRSDWSSGCWWSACCSPGNRRCTCQRVASRGQTMTVDRRWVCAARPLNSYIR